VANQNHAPAGVLRDSVLSFHLEIAKGEWHPEDDAGIALAVYAFGESGRPLQNPGPLIRVPQGTEIRASLHNSLTVPTTVHGLMEPGSDDAVHVAPGATEPVSFKATTPGVYFYWGAAEVEDVKLRYGIDSELTGALVVDPPGQIADDEIFVMEMISEHAGLSSRQTLATINGKSWPFTQRFQYKIGQRVHWRWINATNEPHADPRIYAAMGWPSTSEHRGAESRNITLRVLGPALKAKTHGIDSCRPTKELDQSAQAPR